MPDDRIKNTEAAVALALLVLEFGIDAAIKIIKSLETETVTIEQIRALHDRLPMDEPFFDKENPDGS